MGITIWSKNRESDCGYGGFKSLRQKVADLTSPEKRKSRKSSAFLISCTSRTVKEKLAYGRAVQSGK